MDKLSSPDANVISEEAVLARLNNSLLCFICGGHRLSAFEMFPLKNVFLYIETLLKNETVVTKELFEAKECINFCHERKDDHNFTRFIEGISLSICKSNPQSCNHAERISNILSSESDIKSSTSKSEEDKIKVNTNDHASNLEKLSILDIIIKISDDLESDSLNATTYIDAKVYNTTKLIDIHNEILRKLTIEENNFIYSNEDGTVIFELENTVSKNDINNNDTILLDKKRKRRRSRIEKNKIPDIIEDENDDSISIICTTRLSDSNGESIPRVRVIVYPEQSCKDMMETISRHWNKSALKFKHGRVVLKEEKTFAELGIEEGTEVTVTGGRG